MICSYQPGSSGRPASAGPGIQFVETHGDLSSHYVRLSYRDGETLVRAYMPKGTGKEESAPEPGSAAFEDMRVRLREMTVESVRREVLMSSFR